MSRQAKKILLVLLGKIDPTDSGRSSGVTLKAIAMRLEGDSVFRADGRLLDSVRSASIRRTLNALISGGYVVRRERKGRVLAYMLSERGLEEAARICEEVRGYLAEWAPLLGP